MRALIVTITGPSCSGKSTLEAELVKVGFAKAVSSTTRPMRRDEENGKNYYFLKEIEFNADVEAGRFVEHVEFNGNRYGISAGEVERIAASGKPIVIVCEPNGRDQIIEYGSKHGYEVIPVFISASIDKIAERFIERMSYDLNAVNSVRDSLAVQANYASRLSLIMGEERQWIVEAIESNSVYNFYHLNFDDQDAINSTVEMLVSGAKDYGYFQ